MLLEIHPYNLQSRYINQVIDVLQNDGVIIYPTIPYMDWAATSTARKH